nr:hypothetical protein [Tanacetum cinerariifolium]
SLEDTTYLNSRIYTLWEANTRKERFPAKIQENSRTYLNGSYSRNSSYACVLFLFTSQIFGYNYGSMGDFLLEASMKVGLEGGSEYLDDTNIGLQEAGHGALILRKPSSVTDSFFLIMIAVQSSDSGITFLLVVTSFFRQWEVPSGKDAINHLAVLESLQSCKSSTLDHLPFVKNSPLEACSRSLQGLDPSSEDSPSLLA